MDEFFLINKTEYKGNQLRINGFYHNKELNEDYYNILMFYRNGIVYKPGVSYTGTIDDFALSSKTKTHWGLFIISNNKIKIEYCRKAVSGNLPTFTMEGEIVNDSTFIINKFYRSNDSSNFDVVNEKYEFHELETKPDSTNSSI